MAEPMWRLLCDDWRAVALSWRSIFHMLRASVDARVQDLLLRLFLISTIQQLHTSHLHLVISFSLILDFLVFRIVYFFAYIEVGL
jgi:hypothetical protein